MIVVFGTRVQNAAEFNLKYFCVMGHNILTKSALVSFPQKSSFNTIVQFGHNLGQNHTILFPGKLCLLIHSHTLIHTLSKNLK